jgi:hypothetical protein
MDVVSLDDLPPEMIGKIQQYLSNDDLTSFRCTSSQYSGIYISKRNLRARKCNLIGKDIYYWNTFLYKPCCHIECYQYFISLCSGNPRFKGLYLLICIYLKSVEKKHSADFKVVILRFLKKCVRKNKVKFLDLVLEYIDPHSYKIILCLALVLDIFQVADLCLDKAEELSKETSISLVENNLMLPSLFNIIESSLCLPRSENLSNYIEHKYGSINYVCERFEHEQLCESHIIEDKYM